MGKTVLHKMLEVVSYCPTIQVDMMLHIHEFCSQNGRTSCSTFADDVSTEVVNSVTFVYKHPNCQRTLVEDAWQSCVWRSRQPQEIIAWLIVVYFWSPLIESL